VESFSDWLKRACVGRFMGNNNVKIPKKGRYLGLRSLLRVERNIQENTDTPEYMINAD
jgi:hypothetical protein